MAAVRGGVDGHIGRAALQPALQDSLHDGIGIVVLVESQVVDEEDELLPPSRQGADQPGHLGQPLLLHLDQPQIPEAGAEQHRLYSG